MYKLNISSKIVDTDHTSQSQTKLTFPIAERRRYTHKSDVMYLEDETQRIAMTGNISTGEAITGTVICAKGRETSGGKFLVEDWSYCGLPAQLNNEIADPVKEDK